MLKAIGGDRIKGHILDVSNTETLAKQVSQFFEKIGTFNHLVYTAGDAFDFMTLADFTRPRAEQIFNVRYWALVECVRQAISHMPPSRTSSITFTSATVAQRPAPGWAMVGSGVNGALDALTRGLSMDVAPIRVNCVAPGMVDTELWWWLEEEKRKVLFEEYSKKFLTRSVGLPEEVAEAYVYLIRCNYVTGQTITVDGGASLV